MPAAGGARRGLPDSVYDLPPGTTRAAANPLSNRTPGRCPSGTGRPAPIAGTAAPAPETDAAFTKPRRRGVDRDNALSLLPGSAPTTAPRRSATTCRR